MSEQLLYQIISYKNFDLVIPFVCHKCGACCHDYTPRLSDNQLRELALQRNQSFVEIKKVHEKAYFTGDTGETCPALDEEGHCMIYLMRPDGCRKYPLETLNGAYGVVCLGYAEHWRVYNTIFNNVESHRQEESIIDEKTLLKLLMQAKPSNGMIEAFVRANKISEELVKKHVLYSIRKEVLCRVEKLSE